MSLFDVVAVDLLFGVDELTEQNGTNGKVVRCIINPLQMYVSEDLVVMWDARKQGKDPMAEWKQWKKDQMEQQRLDSERAQAEARASAMNLQQMAQVGSRGGRRSALGTHCRLFCCR